MLSKQMVNAIACTVELWMHLGDWLSTQEARGALGYRLVRLLRFFRAYQPPVCIRLTNRFHVAVHLSSNRSQMTSKCGKNKKVAHEAIAECVTDVLTTFWRPLWSITGQMHGNMESICFI